MSSLTRKLKRFEVQPKGIFEETGTSRWGNRDIYPITEEFRTYNARAFFAYWGTVGISLSSYTLGSTMIAIGLNAAQTIGAVFAGSIFACVLGLLAAQAGRTHYIGFMMCTRSAFGVVGCWLAVLLCAINTIIYFGIQSFYGGQAISLVLSAMIPQFLNLKNTIPESSAITTKDLIGFLLYFVFYIPLMFVRPNRINRYLYPNFAIICATFGGLLGWAVRANGGSLRLLNPAVKLSNMEASFAMVSAISSVAGTYTGATVKCSDWTRFAKTPGAPVVPILTCIPITVTIGAVIGVLVTSASQSIVGEPVWNPLVLLEMTLEGSYTSATRAGCAFAGLGFLSSQVFVNITQNGISTAMDLVAVLPRYIDIRRGGFIVCIIGILIQPWRFLSQAQTFLTILSGFGVFISPLAGILFADYWIVRRQKLKIPDLYKQDGIFWFNGGVNWRGYVTFVVSVLPSMPGFVSAINGQSYGEGWRRIYQLCYFVGMGLAVIIFFLLNVIAPPPGLRVMEYMEEEESHPVVEGESVHNEELRLSKEKEALSPDTHSV